MPDQNDRKHRQQGGDLSRYDMTPEEAFEKAPSTPPPEKEEKASKDEERRHRCVLTRPAWLDSRTEFLREWDRNVRIFGESATSRRFRNLFASMTDEEFRTMEISDERMTELAEIIGWPSAPALRELLRKSRKECFRR